VDQRNLTATVSIADIAAKVENDRRESITKLTQAHDVSAKMVHATLHKDLPFSGSRSAERSTALQGDEKERSRRCQAITAMITTAF
jgi:hypothetical protein